MEFTSRIQISPYDCTLWTNMPIVYSGVTIHALSLWYQESYTYNIQKVCLFCYLGGEERRSENYTCSLAHLVHSIFRLCFSQRSDDPKTDYRLTHSNFTDPNHLSESAVLVYTQLSSSMVCDDIRWNAKKIHAPTYRAWNICRETDCFCMDLSSNVIEFGFTLYGTTLFGGISGCTVKWNMK